MSKSAEEVVAEALKERLSDSAEHEDWELVEGEYQLIIDTVFQALEKAGFTVERE